MLLIDKLSGKPVYEQIIEGIEKNILTGIYPPESVLPSLRELSVTLGINPNTIQKSYAELIRRGIIVPAPGSGTYVAPDALDRILEAAEGKLRALSDLVSELALAGIPEGEVVTVIHSAYQQTEKERASFTAHQSSQEGGTIL
jgi:GntR family transcriptional regulator